MKKFSQFLFAFVATVVFANVTMAAQLPSGAVCFKSSDDQFVVYGDEFANPLYIGSAGKLFEVKQCGFGGTMTEHKVSFYDPHSNKSGEELTRNGDKIVLRDTTYSVCKCPLSAEVVPLPAVRRAEYLFSFPDGCLLYVSADLYNFSYESLKMYIGTVGEDMQEVKITDGFVRYRDGGTTYIPTTIGVLGSPFQGQPKWRSTPALSKEFFPRDATLSSWKEGVPLQRLDDTQFTITESKGTVRLIKNKK